MDYRDTLTYLDVLAGSGIKLELDSMRKFLITLGSPQNGVPAIHVAGSNGKGPGDKHHSRIVRYTMAREAPWRIVEGSRMTVIEPWALSNIGIL